ncbi:hypothetical protein [Dinghuibacter silviterrae]|uniref:HEAT repeat protein n=1 Tax=Dinghuibacter silviterrae TaxID=1539049 RepID=A0A4R8DV59_9BACT|nr:hypothetical protein [Dinghuibacter silviterrae]TDX02300.1 hypothetical protein EDB95_3355 [Dinghuibacter silviterrae]
MNIRQALLEEHSRQQTLRIAGYIGDDPERFEALMSIFFGDEPRLIQRSAWTLSYVIRKHPTLITPYLAQTIDLLGRPGLPTAVPRNILRILQDITVPITLQGHLMDYCFRAVSDPSTPIAVKAFSLTVLHNLSFTYPEILPELETVIHERLPYETAAFRSRARKILAAKPPAARS